MFEDVFNTVGVLLTIAFWAVTIFLLGGGIIMCIGCFTSKSGWEITKAIIAIIAGIFVFVKTSAWLESIPWGLFLAGCTLGIILGDSSESKRRERKPGITDAFIESYCDYSRTKEAVKDAIREMDK